MEPADRTAGPAPGPEPARTPPAVTPSRDPEAAGELVRSASGQERSPRDMAVSLLVLLVPIALLLGFYRVVLGGDDPVLVDPAPAVAEARSAAAFPVSEPAGLAAGWRVISASFRTVEGGRVLRIGYVSPDGGGVQLLQTDVPVDRFLPGELGREARARGAAALPGGGWQRYTARRGEQALVLLQPDRTVVVVGGVTERELGQLAAALR